MTPESIVVSLDYAKRLKKAGWPQGNNGAVTEFSGGKRVKNTPADERSIFYWYELIASRRHWHGEDRWELITADSIHGLVSKNELAAPTASEIIRKIPVEMRGMVSAEKLDDPDEWAKCYCNIQPTNIRLP